MNKNTKSEPPMWPAESEEHEDNLPRSVVEVVPVGEIEEIKGRINGNILSRKYMAEIDGIESFCCDEVWEDGKLRSRTYCDYKTPSGLVLNPYIPYIETWYASGQPHLLIYRSSKDQVAEHFRGKSAEDAPLVTCKNYFEDGTLSGLDYWRLNEEGELRETRKSFYEGGGKKLFWERNFDGEYDSIGGEPAFVTYYKNGQVLIQEWYKDGKYHRERGPAFIEYTQDGQVVAEKYFLDGEEVSGSASLFGYAS